jgi:hypothetical protein
LCDDGDALGVSESSTPDALASARTAADDDATNPLAPA